MADKLYDQLADIFNLIGGQGRGVNRHVIHAALVITTALRIGTKSHATPGCCSMGKGIDCSLQTPTTVQIHGRLRRFHHEGNEVPLVGSWNHSRLPVVSRRGVIPSVAELAPLRIVQAAGAATATAGKDQASPIRLNGPWLDPGNDGHGAIDRA